MLTWFVVCAVIFRYNIFSLCSLISYRSVGNSARGCIFSRISSIKSSVGLSHYHFCKLCDKICFTLIFVQHNDDLFLRRCDYTDACFVLFFALSCSAFFSAVVSSHLMCAVQIKLFENKIVFVYTSNDQVSAFYHYDTCALNTVWRQLLVSSSVHGRLAKVLIKIGLCASNNRFIFDDTVPQTAVVFE